MLRRRRQGTGASPGGPGTDRRPEVAPPVTSGARNSGLPVQLAGPRALTCPPPFEHQAGGEHTRQAGRWGVAPLPRSTAPPHLAPSRAPIPPGHGCR